MYQELFSRRYKLTETPSGLMSDSVPDSARIGFWNILYDFFTFDRPHPLTFTKLYERVTRALKLQRNMRALMHESIAFEHLEMIVKQSELKQYYDICQITAQIIEEKSSSKYESFVNLLDSLFKDEYLGYELREGRIEKTLPDFLSIQVQESRYLLKEPEFKGADQHFEKAIKALSIRSNPDVENCVKDAVAALESVARVITSNNTALLDKIIRDLTKKGVIPKPLNQVIEKIYAYRGNEPGVSHGAVDIPNVTVNEAEFILATSAASIIYLVSKRDMIGH
jgi:hypothetical protein